jgi:hypothetical protein
MLISMPTGTSTIFGVFQVISLSQALAFQVASALLAQRLKLGPPRTERKGSWPK